MSVVMSRAKASGGSTCSWPLSPKMAGLYYVAAVVVAIMWQVAITLPLLLSVSKFIDCYFRIVCGKLVAASLLSESKNKIKCCKHSTDSFEFCSLWQLFLFKEKN